MGGVCLNWGCIPSKALIHAASILDGLRGADKMGILVDNPRVDFARLMGWKDGVIHKLQGGIRQLLGAHGVTLIEGEAEFLTPHRLQVRPAQGDVLTLDAENFLIATGSSPQALPGLAVDGQRMLDVRDLLSMTTLPASLAVIGGGVIGLEMAMAFSKLGAQVTVLEALEDILPDIDPDCRHPKTRLEAPQNLAEDRRSRRPFAGCVSIGALADAFLPG